MRHSVEAKSIDAEQSAAIPLASAKGRVAKRARKPAQKSKKFSEKGSGIRETEEARALLENQLHSLYWWVFNACKMKGLFEQKGCTKLQSADSTLAVTPIQATGRTPEKRFHAGRSLR